MQGKKRGKERRQMWNVISIETISYSICISDKVEFEPFFRNNGDSIGFFKNATTVFISHVVSQLNFITASS
jgi:hypothetical protein